MKSLLNFVGLIIVVGVVGYMAMKQMNLAHKLPAVEGGVAVPSNASFSEQKQQLHQQLQQSVDSADQKLRAELDKN